MAYCNLFCESPKARAWASALQSVRLSFSTSDQLLFSNRDTLVRTCRHDTTSTREQCSDTTSTREQCSDKCHPSRDPGTGWRCRQH